MLTCQADRSVVMRSPCAGAALDPPLWIIPNKALSLSLSLLLLFKLVLGTCIMCSNIKNFLLQNFKSVFVCFYYCSTYYKVVQCVCVFIPAVPIIKLFAWGEGERRRAKACIV
jgi:hypothetical protein